MNIPDMESRTATSAPAREAPPRVSWTDASRSFKGTGGCGERSRTTRTSPASAAQRRSPASQWTPSPTSPATWIHLPRVSVSLPWRITTSRSQNPGSVMERTAAYLPLPAWAACADRSNRLVPARETRKSSSASSMGAPSLPVSRTVRAASGPARRAPSSTATFQPSAWALRRSASWWMPDS